MGSKIKKPLITSLAAALLVSCGGIPQIQDSGDSTIEERGEWSEEQKALMLDYCGAILPYPLGFEGEVSVNAVADDSGVPFLQIINASDEFTIGDYYKDLETTGWSGVKDYNGNLEQSDSSGNPSYEFTKISPDGATGYDLVYYFYKESNAEADEATTPKYNVIQCYNVLDTFFDKKTAWSEEEEATFKSILTETPPLLQLGSLNAVKSSGEDYVYCYDMLAYDLTLDNVEALKKSGYAIDEEISKEKGSYILKKSLSDGASIYASLYYQSGNVITFTYKAVVSDYSSWPSAFISSFEEETGFDIPYFKLNTYYTYTKAGAKTIFGYTADSSMQGAYEIALDKTSLVYDAEKGWYTDWEENFYVKLTFGYASANVCLFSLTFAPLSEPYETIASGWPSKNIASFLEDNSISASFPSIDFSSSSLYSSCRLAKQDYATMYAKCLAIIESDPDNYLENPTEESIKSLADTMAKERTWIKVKVYDKGSKNSDGETIFKANECLIEGLRNAGWSRVASDCGLAFEDPEGQVKATVILGKDVSTLEITYGSGYKHTPKFAFDEENVDLAPGKSYNLQYTLDMLPYPVSFSSSDPDVEVDSKGTIKAKESAEPGKVITITATINVPGEGERSITCTVTITGSYDAKSSLEKVAEFYNAHFNLSSDDENAAKPSRTGTEYVEYLFSVSTSLTSVDELEKLVEENLIPYGFSPAQEEWGEGAFPDGTATYYMEYALYDRDSALTVNLRFAIYSGSDGKLCLKATTSQF